jgi:ribonuclease E
MTRPGPGAGVPAGPSKQTLEETPLGRDIGALGAKGTLGSKGRALGRRKGALGRREGAQGRGRALGRGARGTTGEGTGTREAGIERGGREEREERGGREEREERGGREEWGGEEGEQQHERT